MKKSLPLFDEEVMKPRVSVDELINRELETAKQYGEELVPYDSIMRRASSELFQVTKKNVSDAIKDLGLENHKFYIHRRYFVNRLAEGRLLDYFKDREERMKREAIDIQKKRKSWFYSV